jgi:hypothetical protein
VAGVHNILYFYFSTTRINHGSVSFRPLLGEPSAQTPVPLPDRGPAAPPPADRLPARAAARCAPARGCGPRACEHPQLRPVSRHAPVGCTYARRRAGRPHPGADKGGTRHARRARCAVRHRTARRPASSVYPSPGPSRGCTQTPGPHNPPNPQKILRVRACRTCVCCVTRQVTRTEPEAPFAAMIQWWRSIPLACQPPPCPAAWPSPSPSSSNTSRCPLRRPLSAAVRWRCLALSQGRGLLSGGSSLWLPRWFL